MVLAPHSPQRFSRLRTNLLWRFNKDRYNFPSFWLHYSISIDLVLYRSTRLGCVMSSTDFLLGSCLVDVFSSEMVKYWTGVTICISVLLTNKSCEPQEKLKCNAKVFSLIVGLAYWWPVTLTPFGGKLQPAFGIKCWTEKEKSLHPKARFMNFMNSLAFH